MRRAVADTAAVFFFILGLWTLCLIILFALYMIMVRRADYRHHQELIKNTEAAIQKVMQEWPTPEAPARPEKQPLLPPLPGTDQLDRSSLPTR